MSALDWKLTKTRVPPSGAGVGENPDDQSRRKTSNRDLSRSPGQPASAQEILAKAGQASGAQSSPKAPSSANSAPPSPEGLPTLPKAPASPIESAPQPAGPSVPETRQEGTPQPHQNYQNYNNAATQHGKLESILHGGTLPSTSPNSPARVLVNGRWVEVIPPAAVIPEAPSLASVPKTPPPKSPPAKSDPFRASASRETPLPDSVTAGRIPVPLAQPGRPDIATKKGGPDGERDERLENDDSTSARSLRDIAGGSGYHPRVHGFRRLGGDAGGGGFGDPDYDQDRFAGLAGRVGAIPIAYGGEPSPATQELHLALGLRFLQGGAQRNPFLAHVTTRVGNSPDKDVAISGRVGGNKDQSDQVILGLLGGNPYGYGMSA